MTWQWIAVLAIEIGAIAFLAHRLFGRVAPTSRRKPDVPTSALVRKKR